MISALIVFAQVAAPVMPAGASIEFHAQVLAIEQMLAAGEFAKASERLNDMPTAALSIAWDDAAVPQDQRAGFAQARDTALASWNLFGPSIAFTVQPTGSLGFKFAPTSGKKSHDGSTHLGMWLNLNRPRAEAVIGLSRGDKSTVTSINGVHNDVARAIGSYFGVGDSPVSSTAMYPSHFAAGRSMLMRQDVDAAIGNLRVLDALRAAAAQRQKVTPAKSKLVVGEGFKLGKMLQGEKKQFTIDLKNEGDAPLQMWLKPECGCTTVQGALTVAPGATWPLTVAFDSKEFDGDVTKGIAIVTNDPVQPVRHFKIEGNIRPMYRFLTPAGPVAILDEQGGSFDVYLTFKDVEPFNIKRLDLNGLPGEVDYVAWQGELPDPQRGEPSAVRKGYKITVTIPDRIPPGRSPGTLILSTDSPIVPRVQFTVQAQKGIVALPDELYLGVASEPKAYKLLVSRPGRPFRIMGVTSQSPAFKVDYKQVTTDEYALEIAYDGKAPKGEFSTSLRVTTDDPKQPVVTIPVIGTIR